MHVSVADAVADAGCAGGRHAQRPVHAVRLSYRRLRRLQGRDDWRRVRGRERFADT